MGEPSEQPARRTGTVDDIAGMRIFYRIAGETDERWIDWPNDRGPTIAEAMAVKTATVSNVNLARIHNVLRSTDDAGDDPEALQALVWMVRRFRQGETDLPITALANLDVWSVWQDYFDAQHVFIDFADDEPDEQQQQRAADLAAELQRRLPGMSNRAAMAAAVGLVVAWPDDAGGGDAAGEDQAGGGEPAEQPAPTRKTSKRSSGSGSRNSRTRTGSAGKTSSATPRTPG